MSYARLGHWREKSRNLSAARVCHARFRFLQSRAARKRARAREILLAEGRDSEHRSDERLCLISLSRSGESPTGYSRLPARYNIHLAVTSLRRCEIARADVRVEPLTRTREAYQPREGSPRVPESIIETYRSGTDERQRADPD